MAKGSPNRQYAALTPLLILIIVSIVTSCSTATSQTEGFTATPATSLARPTDPVSASDPILGDVSHFDPIATYPDIAKYAGDNLRLSSANFYYVRSDGTLDLYAKYKPHVYYYFYKLMDGRPPDAPPVGAGGKLNEKWYQPVDVNVTGPENSDKPPKLERYDSQPTNTTQQSLPAPTCSFKKFWAVALEKGAPQNAVATIYYGSHGYSFRISDTSVNLDFNFQCELTRGIGLTPEPTDTIIPMPTS